MLFSIMMDEIIKQPAEITQEETKQQDNLNRQNKMYYVDVNSRGVINGKTQSEYVRIPKLI